MLAKSLLHLYINTRGWKTRRKILVIESDDWGTIRMPGKNALSRIEKNNPYVKSDPYSQFDNLESADDLLQLMDVLSRFKDMNGQNPVFTANTIVANPDFDKIRESGFSKFYFEKFTETISTLSNDGAAVQLWNEAISKKYFVPQLHGREHLHVPMWLSELRLGNSFLLDAFQHRCFSVPMKTINKRRNLMASLDFNGIDEEITFQKQSIKEAGELFKELFGYYSTTFIAPAYIWKRDFENNLNNIGVKSFQGIPIQFDPISSSEYKKRVHFTGEKNKLGQLYTIRNAFFEPALQPGKDVVGQCLSRIHTAFKNNKPAIIGSHRLNYIGSINEQNRTSTLKLLNDLFLGINKTWPDVEYFSSNNLCELILANA